MLRAPQRPKEPLLEASLIEAPHQGVPTASPPHQRKKWAIALIASAVVVAGALVFLFVRGDSADEATGSGSTTTEVTEAEIQTASGTFIVSDVTEGDRYPEGCVEGPSCNIAAPGYKILVIELTPQGSADTGDIMSEGSEAYIVSSDGARTESFMYGWSLGEGDAKEGMVAFTPEESDRDFTLFWPGNEPVALER